MSVQPLKNLRPPSSSVSSSYWSIPDSEVYLSCVATHETDPLIAVASGARNSNLFIYELDKKAGEAEQHTILTHHQTVSLSGIHSLQWASPYQTLGGYGNVLASGHNSGLAYLTLLPDPHSDSEPAEILREFDHKRHIDPSEIKSTRIRNLSLLGKNWTCCADSAIMTLFSQSIFLWDPSRSDVPMMRKRARGTVCLDPSPLRDGVISFGGQRGVSITDIRVKDSPGLSPPNDNGGLVTQIKWSPHDENLLAAVHDSNIVKLWDIRAGGPLVTLNGHTDRVNSLSWSKISDNKVTSASSDGTIRIWNIKNCIEMQSQPPPLSDYSANNDKNNLDWLPQSLNQYRRQTSRYDDIFSHMTYFLEGSKNKPPSTTIFANNREFLALSNLSNGKSSEKLISIDSSGFFGLHTRLNSSTTPEEAFPAAKISDTESNTGSTVDEDLFSSPSSTMTSATSHDFEFKL
ncbi:hypothetical protein TRICI_004093 [Trichomonascus ciferrii]|uniref:Anaphase-promoting complex subunit 4 WD40 domain-containing protein n=1 Tax=Trichomonascus ciferrii TaxID=44093 RepID=A0A642V1A1_9ASCO|nr:hypothetical protein TRICI_004093 [Trichomonascus ciferrii]